MLVISVGETQLFLTSICFGFSFVFQRLAMTTSTVQPLTYSASRNATSTLILFLLRRTISRLSMQPKASDHQSAAWFPKIDGNRPMLWAGFICGICNCFGSALQQEGLVSMSAGKVGFITSLYVVLIPLVLCNRNLRTYVSAIIATVGVYLLSGCDKESCLTTGLGLGEVCVFASLAFWVTSIITSDRVADNKEVNLVDLTMVEFGVSAVFGLGLALTVEWSEIRLDSFNLRAILCIVAVGFSESAGFVLGNLGQRTVSAERTALLYSLEGPVSSGMGWLVLGETMGPVELLGALLCFVAVFLSSASEDGEDEDEEEREGGAGSTTQYESIEMTSSH